MQPMRLMLPYGSNVLRDENGLQCNLWILIFRLEFRVEQINAIQRQAQKYIFFLQHATRVYKSPYLYRSKIKTQVLRKE
jgi:hypothetical protein